MEGEDVGKAPSVEIAADGSPLPEEEPSTPQEANAAAAEDPEQPSKVTFGEDVPDDAPERAGDFVLSPGASLRRLSARSFYQKEERQDHLHQLVRQRRASVRYMDQVIDHQTSSVLSDSVAPLTSTIRKGVDDKASYLKEAEKYRAEEMKHFPEARARMEVRLDGFSYVVQEDPSSDKIKTVYNQSPVYKINKWVKRVWKRLPKPRPQPKTVLDDVNLALKAGKMYLVLGPPASGKTTLLKAIAGRLPMDNGEEVQGSVKYNGLEMKGNHFALNGKILKANRESIHIENAISFIEQLDRHAPRLTVKETFDFSFQCQSGGTHAGCREVKTEEAKEYIKKVDNDGVRVKLVMETLGLAHVADTFVGDTTVRGVSGGQRRRVTVGEMLTSGCSVLCADEISTGLDAASTYDMINALMMFSRVSKTSRVISLLQPSPETVSLFDDIILLSNGKLIYAGPLEDVENYFASLGYTAPEFMDLADFLQMLSTPDGAALFNPPDNTRSEPYTVDELAEAFRVSTHGLNMVRDLKKPWKYRWASQVFDLGEDEVDDASGRAIDMSDLERKYSNSFGRSTMLNLKRAWTIWTRDKRFIIANAIKNAIMGVSVGGVFFNTDDPVSIMGVLFQAMLFIMLGAMVAAPGQLADRAVFYRHSDANFYPAFPYVIGRSIAVIPQAITDVLLFGTILYFMVGLTRTAENYFIFIAVLVVFTLVMNQMLNIFASVLATASAVQGMSAVVLLFSVVFGGFIVAPEIIPNYYIWIYWWNPHAWAYRALVVSEFWSDDWSDPVTTGTGEIVPKGEQVLDSLGFTSGGEVFGQEWVGYSFAYQLPYLLLCALLTGLGLIFVRVEGSDKSSDNAMPVDPLAKSGEGVEEEEEFNLEFTPVTITFEDICYDVKASKGKEQLRLLNNVNGFFAAGRMCALMGSSGAGKTTLMDVIALRKSTGTITGDIRLNGFPQEAVAFRRSSGYVEQFDVQSAELTVRETVQFSARLRLDSNDPAVASDEAKDRYVDFVLKTLELTPLAQTTVGTDEEGGLSFEQKKRLSIAVELAASPSVIFLDEPTSGLDARAALLVCKSLRRIADTGRTVVATIHQPSSAVFGMFDDLLLLKKGGRTVFFGELGDDCGHLVDYFEERGAAPIGRGENPANWMLKVMGGGVSDSEVDFAEKYKESDEAKDALAKIQEIRDNPDPEKEVRFESEFAAPFNTRRRLLSKRLQTIYWRSPSYNLTRMLISAVIGFILGSIFLSNRRPEVMSEVYMTSLFGTVFISFIITGVSAITSVLPVMLQIRDVFYRHQAAGMLGYKSLALALGTSEKWFIVISSFLFCVVYIPCSGVATKAGPSIAFWGFFTFNVAIYSYFGQCFMASVRGMSTAQILASVFIGINNFFSGFIVRPQFLESIFKVSAYITPGSYVYEGMIVALFKEDNRTVVASQGSEFFQELGCDETTPIGECQGSVIDFVNSFFGGEYELSNERIARNAVILGAFLIIARVATVVALKYLRYTST